MTDKDKPDQVPPAGQPANVPEKPAGERSMDDKPAAERSVADKSQRDTSLVVSEDPGPLPNQDLEVVDVRRGMFGVSGSGDTSGYGGLVRRVAVPGATQRPYGGWFDQTADRLESLLPDVYDEAMLGVVVHQGEITFRVAREHLLAVMRHLRDDADLRFEFCSGVSGVHYPHEEGAELHAVYHLLSMTHNRRIRVEVSCPDADPHIPSVVSVYPTNDWHERETFDFFGIVFDGHPALTRIQMPDDWPGHPQRKDYPLGGIPVEYKGATIPPPDQRRSYN
jgi:NADH-quinone oxidoreductase subunit C